MFEIFPKGLYFQMIIFPKDSHMSTVQRLTIHTIIIFRPDRKMPLFFSFMFRLGNDIVYVRF